MSTPDWDYSPPSWVWIPQPHKEVVQEASTAKEEVQEALAAARAAALLLLMALPHLRPPLAAFPPLASSAAVCPEVRDVRTLLVAEMILLAQASLTPGLRM